MRTIKFRGKRVDNGEWVYGYAYKIENKDLWFIDNGKTVSHQVIPETVGQFTGLYDSTKWEDLSEEEKQDFYFQNRSEDGVTIKYKTKEEVKHLWKGKEIYEGDILLNTFFGDIWSVEFIDCCYIAKLIKDDYDITLCNIVGFDGSAFEVIGNIHDNKEIK